MKQDAGRLEKLDGRVLSKRWGPNEFRMMVAPLIIAAAAFSLVSVALSGVLLGLGILLWVADCLVQRRIVVAPVPFKWPLLIFIFLTAFAALFAKDPIRDLLHLKNFIKFIIPFLLVTYSSRDQIKKGLFLVFGLAGASMIWGLIQFQMAGKIDLLDRIDGFMSHWMTYSGQLMMVSIAFLAYGIWWVNSWKKEYRLWSILWTFFFLTMVLTLILTYTRSAWLGGVAGISLLGLLNLRVRWTLLLVAGLSVVFFMMPISVHERLASGFDLTDTTTRGRIDIWRSGVNVALENPWTGIGSSSVGRESLRYREEEDLPEWAYQHSHNNLIHLAAASGFPALAAWVFFWLKIFSDFFRIRRGSQSDLFMAVQASAGISILAAFHLMGLMEFNFGDSEVITLLLFFIAVPYVLDRDRAKAPEQVEPGVRGGP